jgi:hypothetical protein
VAAGTERVDCRDKPGNDDKALALNLASRQNLDIERVDAIFQFCIQHFEYRTVLRHAAQAVKIAGRDSHPKVGLAAFAPSGVAPMLVRLVDHIEVER